ncbi:MAG: hypothetical protein H7175_27910, partial [Burkholderiales bacterium]|nr:hypothetical protein [Anaerolineae bacterium]
AVTADPALPGLIGCSLAPSATAHGSAAQNFERGTMIWLSSVNGGTGTIYAFFSDGRFRRFDDTFVEGVDPATGGETAPAGLTEPARGFGKVWRNNADVRSALGWAASVEQGGSANSLGFERGRAIYLTQRGDTFLLVEDPGGLSGTWRPIAAAF